MECFQYRFKTSIWNQHQAECCDGLETEQCRQADYADALIVCQEEKELEDKRNPAGALKSRATATTIRKEQKGVDPIYQESYTDFIMTTNKDVPIKFDGREDQRRFMIMEADEHFTRKESSLADEVFSKLYGYDSNFNKVGTPFQEDKDLIAQFKHELFTREDIAQVPLRNFPKTAAYKRCFTLPRTTEATEIEAIMRSLAPFIKASLEQNKLVTVLEDRKVTDIISIEGALQFMPEWKQFKKFVAVCRPLVFNDPSNGKPYNHSTVERGINDCAPWLLSEYGIDIDPNMEPLPGGFSAIAGRYRMAPTARFSLVDKGSCEKEMPSNLYVELPKVTLNSSDRIGKRLRVNDKFKADPEGCFETVNEMKPGIIDLADKSQNVQYMDTFLLESDETSHLNIQLEKAFFLGGRVIADLIGNPMELSIFLRIHLLDLHEGVQDTDDKDGGAAVETPDHGRRNLALRGDVCDPDPSEENREEIANKASGIAQQRLNGICLGLLLLSHHVTDHHLEWLHRHIDRGVQEYQGKQAKPHRPVKSEEQLGGEIEASGIGQESHHQHSNDSPDKEIGLSSTHLAPGPVGILPDQGLDDHSHQRRKDPKETELMGVSSKGSEDTADVSALEGVRYLHAEEPEAQVPHVPE